MKKAIVWSKDLCSYCDQAKKLLEANGVDFEERRIGHGWTVQQLHEAVPNAKSVPQIFVDEEYVGGFTELRQKLES